MKKPKKWILRFCAGAVLIFILLLLEKASVLDRFFSKEEKPGTGLPGEVDKRALSRLPGKIAYQDNGDGDWEIWVMRPNGKERRKLTENAAQDRYPRWSYDGKWIAYVSDETGNDDLFRINIATGEKEQLTFHAADDVDPDWSPDGKKIVFASKREGHNEDLYLLDLETKEVTRLTTHGGRNALASWSPGGKKLAFASNRFVGWSVYLFDLETKEVTKLVSGHGACRPDWSADGEWITLVSQKADGKGDIYRVRPSGKDFKRVTTTGKEYDYFPAWGSAHRYIVFARTLHKREGPWNLYIADVDSGKEWRVTDSAHSQSFPDWSK